MVNGVSENGRGEGNEKGKGVIREGGREKKRDKEEKKLFHSLSRALFDLVGFLR